MIRPPRIVVTPADEGSSLTVVLIDGLLGWKTVIWAPSGLVSVRYWAN